MVNTTNATMGGNFETRQLLALPLPGVRTFDRLAFLVPGVALPPQPIGTAGGPGIGPGVGTSGQFSVNGLRSRSNNFTIDGSDNNDEEVGVRRQGFTSLTPQPLESVQEFQISTLLPEPQFGRNMGAQVNAVSRSGGNEYHGTLYGFFTNEKLKARDTFDLQTGPASGEDPYRRWQYGGAVGGPFIKDKTFFFFSLEHQDINAQRESHFAVPTFDQRGLYNRGIAGLTTVSGARVFPTSREGNAFFSLFPEPNNPAGPYGPATFTELLPADASSTVFSLRMDQNVRAFGKEHTLAGRYNFTDDDTTLPVTGEALFSSLRALVRTQNLSLSFISSLSARATNQARFSYGRTSLGFREVRDSYLLPSKILPNEPFLLNARLVENRSLGTKNFVPNSNLSTEDIIGPLGQMIVTGFSPVGVDVFNFPQGRTNNTFQYADTFINSIGKNRLTVGFDIRRTQLNSFLERNFRPLAVFNGAANLIRRPVAAGVTDCNASPTAFFCNYYAGNDFVAVGAPTGFFQTLALNRDSTIGLRFWQNDFFLADQFRITSRFTLTLGLRYELNTVPTEVNRRIESTFTSREVQDYIAFERQMTGVSGLERFLGGRTEIYRRDSNNFAPHVAFAWDPLGDGKTSVRAGYGIYYDQILGAVVSQSRNVFPTFLPTNLAGVTDPSTLTGTLGFINAQTAGLVIPGTLNTYNQSSNGALVKFLENLASARGFVVDVGGTSRTSSNFAGPAFVLPAADLVTPYAQHWGVTVERQVGRGLLLSAAYVGTRGDHLLRFATPNLGLYSIPLVAQAEANGQEPVFTGINVPPGFNTSGTEFAPGQTFKAGRPFPLLGSFTSIESDANSTYHALQLQAEKRFSRGFQFTTAYTWSHAIDDVSDLFDLAGTRALPQNSFDRRAERGDANFDVRHNFSYSLVWNLPVFQQDKILGGWQVASIGMFQTGQPYSILFCCDLNRDGNFTDRIIPRTAQGTELQRSFKLLSLQERAAFEAGTPVFRAPRNTFRAQGIADVDLAINKLFAFGERQRLEFRSEFFNLFNRTHFGIPVNQRRFAASTPNLPGQFASSLSPAYTRLPKRTIQFALKYNF
jgi:hypothetical protein